MAFELRVQFVGVCLFVIEARKKKSGGRVAVVVPDGTRLANNTGLTKHPDGTAREPHVGYMGFSAAHMVQGLTLASRFEVPGAPPGMEVLQRLHRQTLTFNLPDAGAVSTPKLELPEFDAFAPHLRLNPGVFKKHKASHPAYDSNRKYHPVLMRTMLTGGTLETPNLAASTPASAMACWPRRGSPFPDPARGRTITVRSLVGRYYGTATWRRTVAAASVTLQLNDLDGTNPTHVTLHPLGVPGKEHVTIRVGNLCGVNPLEWEELSDSNGATEDTDFKFLYELFEAPAGGWKQVLNGRLLAAPRDMGTLGQTRGTPPVRCGGGTLKVSSLPPLADWDTK